MLNTEGGCGSGKCGARIYAALAYKSRYAVKLPFLDTSRRRLYLYILYSLATGAFFDKAIYVYSSLV